MKKITSLFDLQPDKKNANKGTARGRALLEQSLRKLGAGRSIVVDKHGVIIAGNKTHEVATELQFPIREVETDGKELVVVRRTDLDVETDPAARELGVADNRTAEVGLAWDAPTLESLGIDLKPWFFDNELTDIGVGSDHTETSDTNEGGASSRSVTCPSCGQTFIPD